MEAQGADPAALRTEAAAVRNSSESLRGLAERLDRRAETLAFQGPGALRFRAAIAERSRRATLAAQQMEELAERMQLEASRAEQQAAEARRLAGG
jgi:hypothetical protein